MTSVSITIFQFLSLLKPNMCVLGLGEIEDSSGEALQHHRRYQEDLGHVGLLRQGRVLQNGDEEDQNRK